MRSLHLGTQIQASRRQHVDENESFVDSTRELRRNRAVVGLAAGVILMPLGSIPDWFLYRAEFSELLLIRWMTTIIFVVGLLVLWKRNMGRGVEPLSFSLILVPSLALSFMIYVTDGANSTYYYGLILLTIIVHMLGFGWKDAVAYCVLTIAGYLTATLLHAGGSATTNASLVQGTFFLVTSSAVCVLICYLNQRNRLTEFLLRRELKHQSQQRLDFLADVSHELRTPLSLIVAPLDELLSARGSLSEPIGQRLSIMRRNVDRLRLLVDDLLDVVRRGSTTLDLNLEEIDVREFVEQVASLIHDIAEGSSVRLVVDGETAPMSIMADHSRLERVLLNLLSNAFKFSPIDGTVTVRFRADQTEAQIEVYDEGPGIPEELLEKIFTRRYQAANQDSAKKSQGLGLGLAIANEIVQWHGGRIDAINGSPKGSVFRVWLPLIDPQAIGQTQQKPKSQLVQSVLPDQHVAIPPPSAESPGDRGCEAIEPLGRVLIIDDEPDLRGYLRDALADRHHVEIATSAKEGLEKAIQSRPDCILLDLMLPDAYRLSALLQFRSERSLEDVKILMLTATSDEEIKLEALQSGADDFLPKPFGITELKARVSGLVRSSQLQFELRLEQRHLAESLAKLQQTEQKLFHSEKMRAVAGLAAGLLHEINNPVNFSLMAIRTLQRKTDAESVDGETLQDIHDGVMRISDIISDLRSFAHPEQESAETVFRIRDAVASAKRFASHELDNVEFQVEDNSIMQAEVIGSRSQIVQVLLNLILNSVSAIRRRVDATPKRVTLSAKPQGDRLAISVSDTGAGMSADVLRKIREPFFTTDSERGLGLGLSICESIVVSHGGDLIIESEIGIGTTITFDLPLHANHSQLASV